MSYNIRSQVYSNTNNVLPYLGQNQGDVPHGTHHPNFIDYIERLWKSFLMNVRVQKGDRRHPRVMGEHICVEELPFTIYFKHHPLLNQSWKLSLKTNSFMKNATISKSLAILVSCP